MEKYPLGTQWGDALYTPSARALYRENPWIEALPDSLSDEELFQALRGKFPYDENERTLDYYQREACVQSLAHVFIPLGETGEIARKIDAAIREGYVSRNPLVSGWNREMSKLQECVQSRDADFRHLSGNNANACGFCLVGDSGMGKTSAVNHTLAIYPQVLYHSSYNGTSFPCAQIVWMRLECPQDASVKGLCSEFFMEFDRITGENTFHKFAASGRATTDQMIPQMAMLAQRHGLGLLVIDEIQNLSAAKSGGAQRMLNFIVQLVNKIGLPVLLVGTPPAIGLLSADLMTIRRSTGQQGMTYLSPLERDTYDWKALVKGIWKYQWTAEKTPLSQELQDELHALSHGNIDAAIKLFMETQRLAIRNGRMGNAEALTPELLRQAAAGDGFRLVLQRLALEESRRNASAAKETPRKKPAKSVEQEISAEVPSEKAVSPKQKKTQPAAGSGKTGARILDLLKDSGQWVSPDDDF